MSGLLKLAPFEIVESSFSGGIFVCEKVRCFENRNNCELFDSKKANFFSEDGVLLENRMYSRGYSTTVVLMIFCVSSGLSKPSVSMSSGFFLIN